MCFSASASFTAATALTLVGITSMYFALRSNKRYVLMNLMPFFYAIQQWSEGMIWIHCSDPPTLFWARLFLFFALFVYPWYLGLSCYVLSKNLKRCTIILSLCRLGWIFGLCLWVQALLTPKLLFPVCSLHIAYQVRFLGQYPISNPWILGIITTVYVLLLSLPFFISDRRYMSTIGGVILFSSIICFIIYQHYFISVWCFYAALISLAISFATYFQFQRKRQKLAE